MVNSQPLLSVMDLQIGAQQNQGFKSLVHGVNLEVRRNRIFGLIGESGSGKTLTSRAIAGLLPVGTRVLAGRILFKGVDITDWQAQDAIKRGRDIGTIFQNPMSMLTPVLRIEEQMTEGLRHHHGVSRAEAHERALEFLAKVGLREQAKQVLRSYPHALSGGMLQRVMIAMALLPGPELLIADEPTTALDVTTQLRILEVLADLRAQLEVAILFISHDLAVVSNLCNDVCVLKSGQVVEAGETKQVFSNPQHPYTRQLLDAYSLRV